jgi:hypothetical protein
LHGWLIITPLVISSASSTGVRRVFSGPGPAPEIPGTVESSVFARMPAKKGLLKAMSGFSERNPIGISEYWFAAGLFQDIALHRSTTI